MFSIRTLLLVVAIIAVGVAGLTTRNVWWAGVMSTFTLASLAVAIIATIVCRGQLRLFAIGFAIFVTLYLYAVFSQRFKPFAGTLLTTRLVAASWEVLDVPRPPRPSSATHEFVGYGLVDRPQQPDLGLRVYTANTPEWQDYSSQVHSFFVVAHCLWAFFFGFLGALLADHLARKRVPDGHAAAPESAQSR